MKNLIRIIVFTTVLCYACKKDENITQPDKVSVAISTGETGYIYLDGQYIGFQTPYTINVSKGKHVIGVALQNSFQYLRKEIDASSDITINLTDADKPTPKTWKALWVGLSETKTDLGSNGGCSTHFSKAELDSGYNFFQWSISNYFEKFSYKTMQWQIDRMDITLPVMPKQESDTRAVVLPESIIKLIPTIKPGAYDCIFVFWRQKEATCDFGYGGYLGLGWSNPLEEPIKTGYVTIKFDAGTNINDKINYFKNNDPGVWVHEWLHTVGEKFYQDKGLSLPQKAGDGFVVHAAEIYHYTFPWMNWYLDFISGRVLSSSTNGPKYLGIGPESFLKYCTVSETVSNSACK